jgi:hypothetical protein
MRRWCPQCDFPRAIARAGGEPPISLVVKEAFMADVVEVLIPVEAAVAGALSDARKREAVGRIVSRILRPQPDHDPLLEAMQRLSAEAKGKGLTPKVLEAELAAHKRERTR